MTALDIAAVADDHPRIRMAHDPEGRSTPDDADNREDRIRSWLSRAMRPSIGERWRRSDFLDRLTTLVGPVVVVAVVGVLSYVAIGRSLATFVRTFTRLNPGGFPRVQMAMFATPTVVAGVLFLSVLWQRERRLAAIRSALASVRPVERDGIDAAAPSTFACRACGGDLSAPTDGALIVACTSCDCEHAFVGSSAWSSPTSARRDGADSNAARRVPTIERALDDLAAVPWIGAAVTVFASGLALFVPVFVAALAPGAGAGGAWSERHRTPRRAAGEPALTVESPVLVAFGPHQFDGRVMPSGYRNRFARQWTVLVRSGETLRVRTRVEGADGTRCAVRIEGSTWDGQPGLALEPVVRGHGESRCERSATFRFTDHIRITTEWVELENLARFEVSMRLRTR